MTSTLRLGSRGPEVAQLQKLLNAKIHPIPPLTPDGNFGLKTEAAVRKFQTHQHLKPDGVVGPRTWAALEGHSHGATQNPKGSPIVPPGPVVDAADAPWMPIARREIGQHEIAGPAANPRIIQYHAMTSLKATSDETPWCSSFANWCLRQAGFAGTNSAAAASWMTWGQTTDAREGAITVIFHGGAAHTKLTSSGNHVAFLVEETTSHFVLLGGNQSDQVKISSFPKAKWQLKGHRWPR